MITISNADTNQTIVSYTVQDLGPFGEGYESYTYPSYVSGAHVPGFVGWGPGSAGLQVSPRTIASSSAAGTPGQICWDANYIYVCTAANTWKRAASAPGRPTVNGDKGSYFDNLTNHRRTDC